MDVHLNQPRIMGEYSVGGTKAISALRLEVCEGQC